MIISRTPYRISFFGGGTDYPSFYLENGGRVLGGAIDKYCYITCRKLPSFFKHKYRIVYSKIELVNEIEVVQHPSIRETLKYLNIKDGLEIHHDGDIPAQSGMGSSSSFTVGLLKALYALEGKVISKEELFKKAIYIEQELIKENVGSQDQVWASWGGLNTIDFLPNNEIIVNPIIMKKECLNAFENKFMLFFTGFARNASEIAGEQIKNTSKNKNNLFIMKEMVNEAYKILTGGKDDFSDFGRLLNETWRLKRGLSNKITTSYIDNMYEVAIKNGAIGGKLLGAGGGGFMLFYVEEENQKKIKEVLKDYLYIPFKFDFTGSEIIFYRPDY